MYEDNQGGIAMVKNERISQKSEHLYVCYYFIHDLYIDGAFDIKCCGSHNMTGKTFKKPLGKIKYNKMREKVIFKVASFFF